MSTAPGWLISRETSAEPPGRGPDLHPPADLRTGGVRQPERRRLRVDTGELYGVVTPGIGAPRRRRGRSKPCTVCPGPPASDRERTVSREASCRRQPSHPKGTGASMTVRAHPARRELTVGRVQDPQVVGGSGSRAGEAPAVVGEEQDGVAQAGRRPVRCVLPALQRDLDGPYRPGQRMSRLRCGLGGTDPVRTAAHQ